MNSRPPVAHAIEHVIQSPATSRRCGAARPRHRPRRTCPATAGTRDRAPSPRRQSTARSSSEIPLLAAARAGDRLRIVVERMHPRPEPPCRQAEQSAAGADVEKGLARQVVDAEHRLAAIARPRRCVARRVRRRNRCQFLPNSNRATAAARAGSGSRRFAEFKVHSPCEADVRRHPADVAGRVDRMVYGSPVQPLTSTLFLRPRSTEVKFKSRLAASDRQGGRRCSAVLSIYTLPIFPSQSAIGRSIGRSADGNRERFSKLGWVRRIAPCG